MKKTRLDTEKLYFGFAISLLGYKDIVHGYNYTTISSSYSLGDMIVIGIYKFGNAIQQIKASECFTINLPDKSLMKEIEIGGSYSGEDKFKLASNLIYSVSDIMDAPVIENCVLTMECEVIQIVESDEFQNYSNVIAKIKGRLINDNLQKDGIIIRDLINPVLYLGDGHKRSYRYLNQEMHDFGYTH